MHLLAWKCFYLLFLNLVLYSPVAFFRPLRRRKLQQSSLPPCSVRVSDLSGMCGSHAPNSLILFLLTAFRVTADDSRCYFHAFCSTSICKFCFYRAVSETNGNKGATLLLTGEHNWLFSPGLAGLPSRHWVLARTLVTLVFCPAKQYLSFRVSKLHLHRWVLVQMNSGQWSQCFC